MTDKPPTPDSKSLSGPSGQTPFPTAILEPSGKASRFWILPGAAIIVVLCILFNSMLFAPIQIKVRFQQGFSIKPGDALKYRGINIGGVREVKLLNDLSGITVTIGVESHLEQVAKSGSQFWIVRPRANLYDFQGLDTIVGPRYLTVIPGDGQYQYEFVGLEEPPVSENLPSGGLEIILQATNRGGIRQGAPVSYRGVQVGTVLSVGLVKDAINVDIRAYIFPEYSGLIRENTRFWNASGLDLSLGLLRGFSFDIESLQTLIAGGISLATPENPAPLVLNGFRFPLSEKSEKEWLAWQPVISLEESLTASGKSLPKPIRIRSTWKESRLGGWWERDREKRGWGLPIENGLLAAPVDFFRFPGKSGDHPQVEAEGKIIPEGKPVFESANILILTSGVSAREWPKNMIRRPGEIEDCIAISDPVSPPLPLNAMRLSPAKDCWLVDRMVPVHKGWHGASVVSRKDGKLIGILISRSDGKTLIAFFPENFQ